MRKTKNVKNAIIIFSMLILISSLAQAVVTVIRDDGLPLAGTADEKSVLLREETPSEQYIIRSCLKQDQVTSYYLKYNHKHTIKMSSFDVEKIDVLLDENISYSLDIGVKKYVDADKNGFIDMKIFPESVWPNYACIFVFEVTESTCKPQWDCTSWSLCDNHIQKRTCIDTKKCKGIYDIPLNKQFCYEKKEVITINIQKPWILWI